MAIRASISVSSPAMRGASACSNRSPASVGATERVVRVSSRRPSRASSCLIAWLSVGCEVPSRAAARVKLRSSATARNHSISVRSRRCIGSSQLININSR